MTPSEITAKEAQVAALLATHEGIAAQLTESGDRLREAQAELEAMKATLYNSVISVIDAHPEANSFAAIGAILDSAGGGGGE